MLRLGTHYLRNAALLARAVGAAYTQGAERTSLLSQIEHDGVVEVFGAITTDSGLIFRSGDSVVFAMRGSPSPVDANGPGVWFSNLDAQTVPWARGRVHRQFAAAAAPLFDQAVNTLSGGDFANRRLYVAGHSRGAALATLIARRLADGEPYASQPPTLVCFASPRVGNLDFYRDFQASPLTASTYLFVNSGDPVPHLPTVKMGYAHVEEQWLLGPQAGKIQFGDVDTTRVGSSAFAFALGTLSKILTGQFSAKDFRTHSLDSYLTRIEQAI